jgi:uncharacterized phage protein gp47/JayE
MPWTRPTIQTIYERIKADMETRVTSGLKIPAVSLLGILNLVFTGAIHLTYGFLVWISKQVFVDTASLVGLERWGNILNVPRKPAEFTEGVIGPFTGTGTVSVGTIVLNSEGYEYETQDDFVIGVDTSVDVVAVEAGEIYNTEDTELTLASPIPGVDSEVPVISGFDDGADIETVENWILRLLFRFQNPPAAGTPEDYIRWALEVSGVGKAWCYPAELWAGAGTVWVGVGTDDLEAVPAGVLTDVETYVESKRPIGASVTYANIDPKPVVLDISLTPNRTDITDAIDQNLEDLFILDSVPGGATLLSHIRQAIAAAGPDDYEITEIYYDGSPIGVDNIETTLPEVAKFDSANYSDL